MAALTIRRLSMNEIKLAEQLATRVHLSSNPPFANLNLNPVETQIDLRVFESLIKSGHSYGAFDGCTLIAVRMGYVRNKKDVIVKQQLDSEKTNFENQINNTNKQKRNLASYYYAKYDEMAHLLEHRANVFDRYNVDRALHFYGLAISEKYTRQGLGLQLTEHVMNTAIDQGISCFFTRTSGVFASRIFEKLRFEKLSQLRYDEFLDSNGEAVFTPPEPHYAMTFWAKYIAVS